MYLFNREDIEIKLDYQALKNNRKIPILIEDEMWVKLFSDDKMVKELRKNLEQLRKETRDVGRLLVLKREEKTRLIKKILTLSEKLNYDDLTEGVGLLEEYKRELEEVNEQLETLTFKSETLPSEIRSVNLELLSETVKTAYISLKAREDSMTELDNELNELRERLREIIVEKYDNEDKRNEIYKFLHNILGAEEVNRLDGEILD